MITSRDLGIMGVEITAVVEDGDDYALSVDSKTRAFMLMSFKDGKTTFYYIDENGVLGSMTKDFDKNHVIDRLTSHDVMIKPIKNRISYTLPTKKQALEHVKRDCN